MSNVVLNVGDNVDGAAGRETGRRMLDRRSCDSD
jgi:hypothetical protein